MSQTPFYFSYLNVLLQIFYFFIYKIFLSMIHTYMYMVNIKAKKVSELIVMKYSHLSSKLTVMAEGFFLYPWDHEEKYIQEREEEEKKENYMI